MLSNVESKTNIEFRTRGFSPRKQDNMKVRRKADSILIFDNFVSMVRVYCIVYLVFCQERSLIVINDNKYNDKTFAGDPGFDVKETTHFPSVNTFPQTPVEVS